MAGPCEGRFRCLWPYLTEEDPTGQTWRAWDFTEKKPQEAACNWLNPRKWFSGTKGSSRIEDGAPFRDHYVIPSRVKVITERLLEDWTTGKIEQNVTIESLKESCKDFVSDEGSLRLALIRLQKEGHIIAHGQDEKKFFLVAAPTAATVAGSESNTTSIDMSPTHQLSQDTIVNAELRTHETDNDQKLDRLRVKLEKHEEKADNFRGDAERLTEEAKELYRSGKRDQAIRLMKKVIDAEEKSDDEEKAANRLHLLIRAIERRRLNLEMYEECEMALDVAAQVARVPSSYAASCIDDAQKLIDNTEATETAMTITFTSAHISPTREELEQELINRICRS